MYKTLIALIFCFFIGNTNQIVKAEECEKFAVTASDGYVNVRSSPRVEPDNITGTIYTGGEIAVSTKSQGWWQINSPLSGWVAGNQVGKISCQSALDLEYDIGFPAMDRLAEQAIEGDLQAGVTLIKMSPILDGSAVEVYAEAMNEWANKNPNLLLSLLNQESSTIRQGTLVLIDYGFGSGISVQRQQFEKIINQFFKNTKVQDDWYSKQSNF